MNEPPAGDRNGVRRVLCPESVAIVGMSSRPGSVGRNVLECLRINDYPGSVYLVGRSTEPIDGQVCLASVAELPEGVDLAVLTLPASGVGDAIAACLSRKVKAVIVFAAGFAEVGDRAGQEKMSAMAREGGLAIVGPNCLGFINNVDGLAIQMFLAPKAHRFRAGVDHGAALVGQSGGLLAHMQRAAEARGLPVSYNISTGNEAVLDTTDFADYLVDDATTRVIALYAEQIRRPGDFLAVCERARRAAKPIVLLHPGRGLRARSAVQSHTGAMIGDMGAMRARLEHAGVVLVDTLDEFMDVSEILTHYPTPPTAGPAIMASSGAFCAVVNDFAETLDLDLPTPSEKTMSALAEVMPDFASANNPLDILVTNGHGITVAARSLLDDPNIGSLMVFFPFDGKHGVGVMQSCLAGIEGAAKPVVMVAWGDMSPLPAEVVAAANGSNAVLSRSADRALRAIARVTAYGRALRRIAEAVDGNAVPLPAFADMPVFGQGNQPEWLGKQALAAMGIAVPEGGLTRSIDEAVALAARIGYPVAVKAQAAALAHKTEAGGLILGVDDEAALRSAWDTLAHNVSRVEPSISLDGILVEAMAAPGLELVVGAKRDPGWGPILLIGLGGVWAEAIGDVRLLPPDAAAQTIVNALLNLRSARLLTGFRGAPAVDLQAVANVVASIGRLMLEKPEIVELDINPLVAYPRGVLALDALIVTK